MTTSKANGGPSSPTDEQVKQAVKNEGAGIKHPHKAAMLADLDALREQIEANRIHGFAIAVAVGPEQSYPVIQGYCPHTMSTMLLGMATMLASNEINKHIAAQQAQKTSLVRAVPANDPKARPKGAGIIMPPGKRGGG